MAKEKDEICKECVHGDELSEDSECPYSGENNPNFCQFKAKKSSENGQ